jgi:FkbM family methyltransferase
MPGVKLRLQMVSRDGAVADSGAERSPTLASTLGFIVRHPGNRKRRVRALLTFAVWQLWKRTTHKPITATFWRGLRVRVHPDSKSAGLALYTGLPEYDDMLFTERFLKPGDVVIDVGANIGLYSLLAASRTGSGRVIALEPHPVAADRLRENVALNSLQNVEVLAAAAGAEPGSAQLTANLDTVNHIVPGGAVVGTIRVPVCTLDSLVDAGEQVALVKLDAEGFESAVLAGAGELLRERAVMAWIVEVRGHGGRYGSDDQMVVERFERFGYLPFRYSADRNELMTAWGPTGEAEWNLIFITDSDSVRRRLETAAI